MIRLELEALGLDEGGYLLVARALQPLPVGDQLAVVGRAPALAVHLAAWCRATGHGFEPGPAGGLVTKGPAPEQRWSGAHQSGDPRHPEAQARPEWGLAPRGALVEAGVPPLPFRWLARDQLWAEEVGRLYAQAAAAQWDPATAIPWQAPVEVPEFLEDAVVQVMTYLIENETAALLIPARFASEIHPHFREVQQFLVLQAADEARHVEVFTRRALLHRSRLGRSTVGGQMSLASLIAEPDFELASCLLSVLGEGSFLALLRFLCAHAPDPITEAVCRLAAQDEARHVAFALGHLAQHAAQDEGLRPRLARAIEARHQALAGTAGLNQEVYDALLVLAAGELAPEALPVGARAVTALLEEMDLGRQSRLQRLGFSPDQARTLSALHTRNFM